MKEEHSVSKKHVEVKAAVMTYDSDDDGET